MDDALYVYRVNRKGVDFIEEIKWDRPGFADYLAEVIARRCKNAPVSVLHDGIEQYYRKERVFTAGVGVLDKRAMVDRKLAMVFPSYAARIPIPLGEKVTQKDSKMASDIYLFAAVPGTENLSLTMSGIKRSTALTFGLLLLPVEAVDLVDMLGAKVAPKADRGQWTLLMSQHRNGHLRQIVVKDQNLTLTRMTSISTKVNSNEWAADVAQEFQSTMNYLSRLGFQPSDGLDVILISSEESSSLVRSGIESHYNFYGLTPQQAAKLVGVKIGDDINADLCADLLHVAWSANKLITKTALPVPALEVVQQARWGAAAAIVVMSVAILFTGFGAFSSFSSGAGLRKDLQRQEKRLTQVRAQYNEQVHKMSEAGIDLPLIQTIATIHRDLEKSNVHMFDLIRTIAKAMNIEGSIEKIDVSVPESVLDLKELRGRKGNLAGQSKSIPTYEFKIWLAFGHDVNVDLGNQDLRRFRDELRKALPDQMVNVSRFLGEIKSLQDISVLSRGFGVEQLAQITIQGPLLDD